MAHGVIVDHVTLAVPDGEATARRFREEHGLGSFGGAYLGHLGAWSYSVPLTPPSYVEWLAVDDPAVAAGSETGQRVLAAAEAGGALLAWTLLVDDIEAVARRTGIDAYEGQTRTYTGALRRWSTVTGPRHLPIFIAYEDPMPDRLARWQDAYDRAGHDCAPGGFIRIEVGGSPDELADWLGPHDLPVAHVPGPPGIRAAHVETARGTVVVA